MNHTNYSLAGQTGFNEVWWD